MTPPSLALRAEGVRSSSNAVALQSLSDHGIEVRAHSLSAASFTAWLQPSSHYVLPAGPAQLLGCLRPRLRVVSSGLTDPLRRLHPRLASATRAVPPGLDMNARFTTEGLMSEDESGGWHDDLQLGVQAVLEMPVSRPKTVFLKS